MTPPPEPSDFNGSSLAWRVDPTLQALCQASRERDKVQRRQPDELPEGEEDNAACIEVGRRLLLAQFDFSGWVLRRVEKVQFASDRRISRRSSIEFQVPDYAPVLLSGDDPQQWLIPLTVMRRRTLVNLDLEDEAGHGISMLGLRFTQSLDESMLRAAARMAAPDPNHDHTSIDAFIHKVIAGNWQTVRDQRNDFNGWRETFRRGGAADPHALAAYFADATFRAALERMWHNFSLYVSVPVEQRRHRILRLAFEEPVEWTYQEPRLQKADGTREVWDYKPIATKLPQRKSFYEFFGWSATRIRFLTPSAENCASYHFEFSAPTGLWVTSAALVAGRPNVDAPKVTAWDAAHGYGPSVGLHCVEVPNGSLCRAQVELRLPSRGWLSTLLFSCLAALVVLVATAWHARLGHADDQWSGTQITNIVLLLVTVAGGAATYVAQHPSGDVAARMVVGLRTAGAIVLVLPAAAAMMLVFLPSKPDPPLWLQMFLAVLAVLALLATFSVGLVIYHSWRIQRAGRRRVSPWDMTEVDDETDQDEEPLNGHLMTFFELTESLDLHEKAIGVNSAEGWHEVYGWTSEEQQATLERLRDPTDTNGEPLDLCQCPAAAHAHPRGF